LARSSRRRSPRSTRLRAELREAFLRQAEACERSGSLLYADVCRRLADDEAVAAIVAGAIRWDFPIRLLGALHYLQLAHELDPWRSLHDVLIDRREELRDFVADHDVQTNEVGRCFALLPAFLELARGGERPLELLELGPSAGLNLLFDRYRYHYDAGDWGPHDAEIVLSARERRGVPADLLATGVAVRRRRGIDLHPIDVCDDDATRVLKAFVWADQPDRLARLDRALAHARREPPELIRGDYVDLLPDVVKERDADSLLVVFQTASTQYLPRTRYDELRRVLRDASREAPLAWVSTQRHDEEAGRFDGWALELASWPEQDARVVAYMGYHGEWLDYVA
jgi:hypothetical protein